MVVTGIFAQCTMQSISLKQNKFQISHSTGHHACSNTSLMSIRQPCRKNEMLQSGSIGLSVSFRTIISLFIVITVNICWVRSEILMRLEHVGYSVHRVPIRHVSQMLTESRIFHDTIAICEHKLLTVEKAPLQISRPNTLPRKVC